MGLFRARVRIIVVAVLLFGGVVLLAREARADCARNAADAARPVCRDVETSPPKTLAESRSAGFRLAQYAVMP